MWVIVPSAQGYDAANAAKCLFRWCLQHSKTRTTGDDSFTGSPSTIVRPHHPLTRKAIDFARTEESQFRAQLQKELTALRKVALRLGRLAGTGSWTVRTAGMKELLAGKITVQQLAEHDVVYEVRQKGVDMRIGLDIAALAFKRQVDQVVLIAGDSDFVPAAKLARREGIEPSPVPRPTPRPPDTFLHPFGPPLHPFIG